jgi:hypothetical protein
MLVGLVHDRPWEPPSQDEPPDEPVHRWHVPWRPVAWFAVWCWLMALVPILSSAVGGLAGYAALLAAVGLVGWRVDRWCARQYWGGLREHKS